MCVYVAVCVCVCVGVCVSVCCLHRSMSAKATLPSPDACKGFRSLFKDPAGVRLLKATLDLECGDSVTGVTLQTHMHTWARTHMHVGTWIRTNTVQKGYSCYQPVFMYVCMYVCVRVFASVCVCCRVDSLSRL